MTTELITATVNPAKSSPMRVLSTLAIGLLGGCALGIIARAWMRLITKDPEFTWRGTISIVAGFTIFGLAQSIVAVARRRQRRRWTLTIVRTIGAVAMLPLFVAAGSVMLPTVVGCGLASARTEWRTTTRSLLLLVAAGPVLYVANDLIGFFGWSLHTLAGLAMMFAIYATIVWATRFTFSAQADGWRPSRTAKLAVSLVTAALISILFVAGGGFK